MGRILGGKATTKKNGNSYFYYYCKLTIKENTIETFISEFIDDIVVNQFFLPMIKQKVENPKEGIEEEIKKQKDKFKRIRAAYINEVFTLEGYDLGILYIKKDDGTLLEDEEAAFKYIPDKTDGVLTREVKPTLVKPANVMGLEEMYDEETDEVVSS